MLGKTRFAAYCAPLVALASAAFAPSSAMAASCGTVAAPTACTFTVGSLQYTASGFSLSGVSATGVTAPAAADIAIDLSNPSGTQARMEFRPAAGGSFTTNVNQSMNFTVNYTMTVAPAIPGTAVFQTPALLTPAFSSAGNGSAQISWTIAAQPACTVTAPSAGANCPVPAASTSLASATAVAITGSTDGSALWTFVREVYDATFTAAPVQAPVLTKTINPPTVQVGGTTVMTFTITNPNQATALTSVAFLDVLPAGLSLPNGSSASTLSVECAGATFSNIPANTLTVSLPTLAAGATCTLTFAVRGDVAGNYTNTTSAITAVAGTAPVTGNSATAPLQVVVVTSFLVRYASNLSFGESVINLTNSGASSTPNGGATAAAQNGEICANIYAYSPDEQLVSCCSCNVTPNGLNSLSVKADLGTNTLTPIIPSALVIKIIGTAGGAACTAASAATANTAALQPGLEAWGTTIHALPVTAGTPATTYGVTETAFARALLSQAELNRMTGLCAFIRANGSGYGICKSCKVGGLGGSVK